MSWSLRPEEPTDAAALEHLHTAAFRRAAEAQTLALHRAHDPTYDRQLSLLAVAEGTCLGHVLLTRATIRLGGEDVPACLLGPIAVTPAWQGRGVGAALLEGAHAAARAAGAALVFLTGHPGYYPRFGYAPLFGFAQALLTPDQLPPPRRALRCRPIREEDGPWLAQQHRREWAAIDFAWMRTPDRGAWAIPGAEAVLWETEAGVRAAYTYVSGGRDPRTLVVAEDPALARDALLTLRPRRLEHHPEGWLARTVLADLGLQATVRLEHPCMALPLRPGVLDPVRQRLDAGRLPGSTILPIAFSVC